MPRESTLSRTTRRTWLRDIASGRWWRHEDVAYYACQVRLDAPAFVRVVPGHWGVEDRNHYLRDRVLREGDSRIQTKPGICTRLRSVALNVLRASGVANVSEAVYPDALSLERLLAYAVTKSGLKSSG